jgi:hypothetical protein
MENKKNKWKINFAKAPKIIWTITNSNLKYILSVFEGIV